MKPNIQMLFHKGRVNIFYTPPPKTPNGPIRMYPTGWREEMEAQFTQSPYFRKLMEMGVPNHHNVPICHTTS